jgi:hypothetical protein
MKKSSWAIVALRLSVVALLIIVAAGCGKPTPSMMGGVYSRTDASLVESITLNKNGTFDQTVTYSDGQRFKVSDQWISEYRKLQFKRLYITRDVESSKILSPPELRYGVNFVWERGVLVKDLDQGYLLRCTQKDGP